MPTGIFHHRGRKCRAGVSSVGYTSQEVAVNNRSTLTIVLVNNTQNLGEVVVTCTGYYQTGPGYRLFCDQRKPDELFCEPDGQPDERLARVPRWPVSIFSLRSARDPAVLSRSASGASLPLVAAVRLVIINGGSRSIVATSAGSTVGVPSRRRCVRGWRRQFSMNPDDIKHDRLEGAPAAALYSSRAKDRG